MHHIGPDQLTLETIHALLRDNTPLALSGDARRRIQHCRAYLDDKLRHSDELFYGINTGFGPLCTTRISPDESRQLQENLLRSHSVGVGEAIPAHLSKLMLLLKIQAWAQGFSGVSAPVIERLLWHLNQDMIPVVPSQGSVGASGDLAPLSHLFLPLIGEGYVWQRNHPVPARDILAKYQMPPINLGPKDSLGLINGTQFMAAFGMEIAVRLHRCLAQADLIAAMMIDGLKGSLSPFDARLHRLRPHQGSSYVAHKIHAWLHNSAILHSHVHCDRVQDPYSLRCVPQVHGASWNAWRHLKEAIQTEINAVTDNPIILDGQTAISGGNFHGQLIALPLDYAGLAAAELGNISDRRIYLSMDGKLEGLPKLLMTNTGLNSGFMILQYTSAALVSENKSLCFPASADSIPTSLGQEDHVSMGSISARKTLRIIENLEHILAIEWICAAQALEFRRPLVSTLVIEAVFERLRLEVSFAEQDRIFAEDIAKAVRLFRQGVILDIIQSFHQNSPYDEIFGLS